jgi:hypothetical protein
LSRATLPEFDLRLRDEKIFNAVLVLMVVTSILGPVLTERFAPGMIEEDKPRRLG